MSFIPNIALVSMHFHLVGPILNLHLHQSPDSTFIDLFFPFLKVFIIFSDFIRISQFH